MKLTIRKYKRIDNLSLEIPAQITGGNGLGKSTILEAISFCLIGKDLQGNEIKQVYDNRVDLHAAIADVSIFDDYGNEFRRVVKPNYTINRSGAEELKTKRSTQCSKNGIDVSDYSDEFSDFLNFGTDFFFKQKEDVQRSIFIDILKSKLPDYDLQTKQTKLSQLNKKQKEVVSEVKNLRSKIKDIKDVDVFEITDEFEAAKELYNQVVSSALNQMFKLDFEQIEISKEEFFVVIEIYREFVLVEKGIIGQQAINENNAKLREQYAAEIKTLQTSLFTIGEQISVLAAEISEYFRNLNNVVKSEFKGDISIDVQLSELIITTGEYKDVFKITANGKVFPHETNGALQNNLKLQVLSTFQRLKDYKGVTIMDNCESNTTDKINTCGMKCVLAGAGYELELTINS